MKCNRCGTESVVNNEFYESHGVTLEDMDSKGTRATRGGAQGTALIVLAFLIVLIGGAFGLSHLLIKGSAGDDEEAPSTERTAGATQHDAEESLIDLSGSNLRIANEKDAEDALVYVLEKVAEGEAFGDVGECSIDEAMGVTYYRFAQEYKGIPVYGAEAIVSTDSDNQALAVSHNYQKIARAETSSSIDQPGAAKAIAKLSENARLVSSPTLVLLPSGSDSAVLAYQALVEDSGVYARCFVSASDGNMIRVDALTYTESVGTLYRGTYGLTVFDADKRVPSIMPTAMVDEYGNAYTVTYEPDLKTYWIRDSSGSPLDDEENGLYYRLFKDGKTIADKGELNSFIVETSAGALEPISVDIQKLDAEADKTMQLVGNLRTAYDFYDKVLSRESFDGQSGTVDLIVNSKFTEKFLGIDWDTSDNASSLTMAPHHTSIQYGYKMNPYLDVVAHEYTHSVETTISHMTYSGESGALMEAISDIFGELVEDYSDNGKLDNTCDWKHGNSRIIREPKDSENPSEYGGDKWLSTDSESGDRGHVHNNSTVVTYAAYLMCNGSLDGEALTTEELAKLIYASLFSLPSDCTFARFAGVVENNAAHMLSRDKAHRVSAAFEEVKIKSLFVVHLDAEDTSDEVGSGQVEGDQAAIAFVRTWYDDWSLDGDGYTENKSTVENRCLPLIDEASELNREFSSQVPAKAAYRGLDSVDTCVVEEPVVVESSGSTYRVSVWYTSLQEPNWNSSLGYQYLMESRRHEASWDVTLNDKGKVTSLSLVPRGPYTLSGKLDVYKVDKYGEQVTVVAVTLDNPITFLYEYKCTEHVEARVVAIETSNTESFGQESGGRWTHWSQAKGRLVTIECDDLTGAIHDASAYNVDALVVGEYRVISIDSAGNDESADSQKSVSHDRFDGKQYWVVFTEGFRGGRVEASSFDVISGTPTLVWDRNITVSGATIDGNVSQFRLTDDGAWEKIGEYDIPTDWAMDVLASNAVVVDSSGASIEVPDTY